MEALLFMLNSMAMVLMVFMGLRDDRRPPGVPHTSLFRLRDEPARSGAKAPRDEAAGEADQPGWADWSQGGDPPQ